MGGGLLYGALQVCDSGVVARDTETHIRVQLESEGEGLEWMRVISHVWAGSVTGWAG